MEKYNNPHTPPTTTLAPPPRHPKLKTQQTQINPTIDCKLHQIPITKIQSQLRIAKWRFQTDYPILKIFHFSYSLSTNSTILSKIIYQLPQTLFANLTYNLNLSNTLYCLKTIFITCEKLIQTFGYFLLTQKMIGIMDDQSCKIWINQHFYANSVMYQVSTQSQMINSIINIIQKIIIKTNLSSKLLSLLHQQKKTSMKMIQLIWKFSYDYNILIPPFFQSQQQQQQQSNFFIPMNFIHHHQIKSQRQITKYNISENCKNINNQFDVKTYKTKKKSKDISANHQLLENTQERNTFQLNKNGYSSEITDQLGTITSRIRTNSKSDFISTQLQKRQASLCPTHRYHLSKINTSKIPSSQKTSPYKRQPYHYEQNQQNIKIQQNKQKMRDMIHQKLKSNRKKKRMLRMETINTVKSIGQFTDSQKKIFQQSISQLQYLHKMGRKIDNSYFNPDDHDPTLTNFFQLYK